MSDSVVMHSEYQADKSKPLYFIDEAPDEAVFSTAVLDDADGNVLDVEYTIKDGKRVPTRLHIRGTNRSVTYIDLKPGTYPDTVIGIRVDNYVDPIEDFITRYLPDVEVYPWQRKILNLILEEPDAEILVSSARLVGRHTFNQALCRFYNDRV